MNRLSISETGRVQCALCKVYARDMAVFAPSASTPVSVENKNKYIWGMSHSKTRYDKNKAEEEKDKTIR